jgi:hypothetical protein
MDIYEMARRRIAEGSVATTLADASRARVNYKRFYEKHREQQVCRVAVNNKAFFERWGVSQSAWAKWLKRYRAGEFKAVPAKYVPLVEHYRKEGRL